MPKEVEAHLPDGRVVTVQGVPDDLSTDDFKAQFRQRHPEYFGADTASASQTAAPSAGSAGAGNPQDAIAQRLQMLQNARQKMSESVPGQFAQRGMDIVKGIGQTFDPRQGLSDLVHGDIAGAIANTPIYRMAHGLVEGEKQLGPQVVQQTKTAVKTGDPLQYARAIVSSLSMADPFATQSVANVNQLEDQGKNKAAIGQGAADALSLAAGGKSPEVAKVAPDFFRSDLAATSHDILNRGANQVKGKLWDAHAKVGQRVGQLKNDIAAADYQAGEASIPVADLWSKVQDIADQYKATGKDTPKFAAAADAIKQRGPYLTWKELDDLKQEIDPLWRKSAEGSRDAGATNALRDAINKKLSDRAAELDRGQQYKAYNQLWSTLKKYESDGALGKLLNASNGSEFMDVLKDPANKAELSRTLDSLSKFGLPKDILSEFSDSHSPLHNYVKDAQKTGIGKLKVMAKHPIAGTAGVVAGTGLGAVVGHPEMGGIIGGIAGSGLADRIAAARAVNKLGAPSLEGEMTEAAKVKPVGSGERPEPPAAKPGAVNRDELIEALKSLGYKKDQAAQLAMQGIAENPTDFNAALKRAMQGPAKTPAAKAQTIQQIKPVSGGSQAADIVVPKERGSIVRSGPKPSSMAQPPKTAEMIRELRSMEQAKITPRAAEKANRAMDAKSIRSHNDAFEAAKQEWQDKNPGKDASKHLSEIARRAENLRKGK